MKEECKNYALLRDSKCFIVNYLHLEMLMRHYSEFKFISSHFSVTRARPAWKSNGTFRILFIFAPMLPRMHSTHKNAVIIIGKFHSVKLIFTFSKLNI